MRIKIPLERFGNRMRCLGNCGAFVIPKLGGECRKCRKARIRKGLKHIKRLTK